MAGFLGSHPGSWGGLPDFGITERITNFLAPNVAPTAQGGSNFLQNPFAPASTGGQTLGATTSPIIPGSQNVGTSGNPGGVYGPQLSSSGGTPSAPVVPTFSDNSGDSRSAAERAAQDAYNAENQSLNTQFDYLRAQSEGQLGSLGRQRDESLAQVDLGLGDVNRQVGTSKTNLQTNTQSQIKQAGSTARNVQGQNRNVLRALGILNSSAAGQILAKPLNQFDEQRAQLGQFLVQKTTELDDFVNQKVSEASKLKDSIVGNYNDLVGKIQTDMRFNERQRNDALKAANAALSQRMAEISQAVMNYQNQAQLQKQQFQASMAAALNYQNPTYNKQALLGTAINTPGQQIQTAQMTPDELKRRQQLGLT